MSVLRIAICFLLVFGATAASAAPIQDVAAWSKEFDQAALANEPEAMFVKMSDVAHPSFNLASLHGALQKLQSFTGSRSGDFVEEFDERNVGTFLKRINVAVHYPTTYMFYTTIFLHDSSGWQMVQFNYNTNINEALDVKWPQ